MSLSTVPILSVTEVSESANLCPLKSRREKKIVPKPVQGKDLAFSICPQCNNATLKFECGCMVCVNPKCGFSKCDY